MKVCSLVLHMRMGFLEQDHRFPAIVTAALPPCHTTLRQSQPRLGLARMAWVVHRGAIRQRRKRQQADIQADASVRSLAKAAGHTRR